MRGKGGSAVLSECGTYRYRLERRIESCGNLVTFIMLNPSTADAEKDDPTIRRCMGFARSWGFARLIVVNLFALRATDPNALCDESEFIDPTGPDNLAHIQRAKADSSFAVVAWGAHPAAKHARPEILAAALDPWRAVMALGLTKDGSPRHPLYVRGDARPVPYRKD